MPNTGKSSLASQAALAAASFMPILDEDILPVDAPVMNEDCERGTEGCRACAVSHGFDHASLQFGRVRAQEEAKRAGRGEEAQLGDATWTSVTVRGIMGLLTYRERDGRRADHEAKHDTRWEVLGKLD